MESEKKKEKFSEKIKKGIRKAVLTAGIMASSLLPSYSTSSFYRTLPDISVFHEYEIELKLLKKAASINGNLNSVEIKQGLILLKTVRDSIIKKQEKKGEFNDAKLDFMRVVAEYNMARGPPDPEVAEKYLVKSYEIAQKYYKRWKMIYFLDYMAMSLYSAGYMFFNAAEEIKDGSSALIILNKNVPADDYEYTLIDKVYGTKNLPKTIPSSLQKEVIIRTVYKPYHEKTKYYFERFLELYEKEMKTAIDKIEDPNMKEEWKEKYNIDIDKIKKDLGKINIILGNETKSE